MEMKYEEKLGQRHQKVAEIAGIFAPTLTVIACSV
jgi:hypothetical protein